METPRGKRVMRRIRSALTRFENAARNDEMRGCQHPDIRDYINEQYHLSRAMIERIIEEELSRATHR